MAQQIGSLYASMSLNSASFISGLERASKATDRATNSINKAMSGTANAVKGFLAVMAAGKAIDGASEYLRIADSAKKMDAQLRLATAQFGNMGVAQQQVHEIAKNTRSGLEETTSLYSKMLVASKDLGRGQLDAGRATETFSKALKIGGADAASSASATLQFGQALASGVLRGDEFNSVNEASPRIMRLLAESMGQPVGALRKMAEEGKLTSDVLFKALTDPKFTSGIDAEFKELPATFEQAKVLIENGLTDMIGAFDRGSGISDGIVDGLGEGTTMMDTLVRSAEQAGADMRAEFAGLHDAFVPMLDGGTGVLDALGIKVQSFHDQVLSIFRSIDRAANIYIDADNWGTKIENGFKRGMNRAIDRAGGGQHFNETPLMTRSNLAGNYEKGYQESRVKSARERLVDRVRRYGTDRDFTGKGMSDQEVLKYSKTFKWAKPTAGTGKPTYTPPPKAKTKGGTDKAKSDADKAQRDQEREVERARRALEAFTADKNRSEGAELDSKAALASTAQERFNFERLALEQDKKTRLDQIDKDGPKGSKRYTDAQVLELKAIEERIDTNKRQSITLKEAEFNAQEELKLKSASLANAGDLAQLQGGMALTAKDRRASDLRLLDLQMQQEKLALDAIIASRDSTDADKKIAQARLAMLPTLRAAQGKQVEKQAMGPLESYLNQIPRTGDEINEALESVEVNGLESLQSGLLDAIKGVGSLGDAFGNMADAVIDGLLKIALQQMLIKPLGDLLFGGGGSGGGGGLFGSLVSGLTSALTGKPTTGKANGGMGNTGRYLVGEHGPEYLDIGGPFFVTPNSKIAPDHGGTGVTGKANGGMGNKGRYLVGEHGPEYVDVGGPFHVTPNSKLDPVRGGAGGGLNVTFGSIISNDPEAVKAMALQAITEMAPMLAKQSSDLTMGRLQRPRM
ncbi:tape measure protein [Sphingomonas sp. PB2P19]|uniref:tape measure protein n=1 Tax=Sphingomonas rhamnosi TaxID=3096156 RepID=UPI002FC78B06